MKRINTRCVSQMADGIVEHNQIESTRPGSTLNSIFSPVKLTESSIRMKSRAKMKRTSVPAVVRSPTSRSKEPSIRTPSHRARKSQNTQDILNSIYNLHALAFKEERRGNLSMSHLSNFKLFLV